MGVGKGSSPISRMLQPVVCAKALAFLLNTSLALRPFKKACSEHAPCNKANCAFTIQQGKKEKVQEMEPVHWTIPPKAQSGFPLPLD